MLKQILNTMQNKEELIDFIKHSHEKHYLEFKKATNLPKAFWETYSAFCNTSGGVVVLGVVESEPENEITGVGNKEKIITELWDLLSNPNKVSFSNITNEDVIVVPIDETKTIIVINIQEAPDNMKPVYLEGKINRTFLRTGDGDRIANQMEINSMLRNAQPGQDSLLIDNYTLDDLDPISVMEYKTIVGKRNPLKNYTMMSDDDFLLEIGACALDRRDHIYKIKKGTLLFLGKCNAIKEMFPQFHLDYYNRRGNNSRWDDRVSDDDPSDVEMNIFQFYRIVDMKLKSIQQEAFQLDSQQIRMPFMQFDETIREALANTLAHADYIQAYPSIKIEVFDGWYRFQNPGKMLVSPQQFIIGGDSRPRNEIIMKLFRLMGVSERQGAGGPMIYKSAKERQYRSPEIETTLEQTVLKIWNIDLIDSYPDLDENEKAVFRCIVKSSKLITEKEIRKESSLSEYYSRKAISSLIKKGLIGVHGKASATAYHAVVKTEDAVVQIQLVEEMLRRILKNQSIT